MDLRVAPPRAKRSTACSAPLFFVRHRAVCLTWIESISCLAIERPVPASCPNESRAQPNTRVRSVLRRATAPAAADVEHMHGTSSGAVQSVRFAGVEVYQACRAQPYAYFLARTISGLYGKRPRRDLCRWQTTSQRERAGQPAWNSTPRFPLEQQFQYWRKCADGFLFQRHQDHERPLHAWPAGSL